jgi:hypothetical protein
MFSQWKTVESVELLCCSGVEVLVGKAIRKNVQVLVAKKRQTKDKRRMTNQLTEWSEFSRLVRILERLVRIPNDWYEFRTIGPNSEWMTSLMLRPYGTCWRSEICQSVKCQKKLAWTDLDRVSFKKFVKQSSVKIKKLAWTGLDKVKRGLFSGKCLFKKFLHDWSHKKTWSDKRCSSCYTLRGCVLADVQAREELKML